MPTTFANTIDGNDIYAKRAECDAAGNTLSTTYATKAELPEVPEMKSIVAGSNVTITSTNNGIEIAATDTTYTFSTGLTESSGTVTVTNPVPSTSSSDNGKVLGVTDSSGTLGWVSQPTIPTVPVQDVEVDGTSVLNAQGVAEIAMPTELVPTVGSTDDGKVLKATYSGGVGSYAWAAESGGGTTYTAGNMISLTNNAIAVSTTAGITDIQQVNALPASPVATVLYLIPET